MGHSGTKQLGEELKGNQYILAEFGAAHKKYCIGLVNKGWGDEGDYITKF